MHSDARPAPSSKHEELKAHILAERDAGNIVFRGLPGSFMGAKLDVFVEQPVDGILYDLNRDEATVLTFIHEPKWVNDFAVAQTIRKLVAQRDALRAARSEIQPTREDVLDEVLRGIATLTNRYMNTVEDYYLHGLWRAREVVEGLKKAAPQPELTGTDASAPVRPDGAAPCVADPMVKELKRLKEWFEMRDHIPGAKSQIIHIGMVLDAATPNGNC